MSQKQVRNNRYHYHQHPNTYHTFYPPAPHQRRRSCLLSWRRLWMCILHRIHGGWLCLNHVWDYIDNNNNMHHALHPWSVLLLRWQQLWHCRWKLFCTIMQVINNELIFFRKFSDPSRFFQHNFFNMVIKLCLKKYMVWNHGIMLEWFALISLFLKNCVCALNSYLIQTQSVGRRTNPGCIITNWKFSRCFFQYQCTKQ